MHVLFVPEHDSLQKANDNRITDLNHLDEHLGPKFMPSLDTVYLEGNPAQRSEGASYRRKVQLALPQIAQLDATYVSLSLALNPSE